AVERAPGLGQRLGKFACLRHLPELRVLLQQRGDAGLVGKRLQIAGVQLGPRLGELGSGVVELRVGMGKRSPAGFLGHEGSSWRSAASIAIAAALGKAAAPDAAARCAIEVRRAGADSVFARPVLPSLRLAEPFPAAWPTLQEMKAMVKQAKNPGVDPRDLWLAGLGVVSLTRKQAT